MYKTIATAFILHSISAPAFAETETPPPTLKHCDQTPSWWEKGWNASIFGGIMTNKNNSDFFTGDMKIRDAYPIGFGVGKKMANLSKDQLDFEMEANFVQYTGDQTHQEIQPFVFILRWIDFPWNDHVKTSFAAGDGLSVATEKPKLEVKERGSSDSNAVLNYVLLELTFADPDTPELEGFIRYHHRSGVFGTFNGTWDAATAFMIGAKYHF